MTSDPFKLLAISDEHWPQEADPLSDALSSFDPENPVPLVELLESKDLLVSRRGLYVFGELGRKGAVVLDTALKLAGHPDPMARNALMDGVICYPKSLSALQVSKLLNLVTDPFPLVRHKAMVVLAAADIDTLKFAIVLLDEPQRAEHSLGIDILLTEQTDIQKVFDEAIHRDDVWAAYSLASLERMAWRGTLQQAPINSDKEYLAESVVAQLNRLIARHKRMQR